MNQTNSFIPVISIAFRLQSGANGHELWDQVKIPTAPL